MAWVYHNKPPMGWPLDLDEPVNQGRVGHWPLLKGSGGQVFDLSENGNTGTFQGTAPSWTSGKFGPAVLLPGTDEFIDCGNPAVLDLGAVPQTICIWFKPGVTINDALNDTFGLISRAESGTTANNDWTLIWDQVDSGRMRFGTYGNNIQTITASWTANQTYCVIVSYVSATNATIYVDGAVDNYNSDFNPGAIDGNQNNKLRMGVYDESGPNTWYGNVIIEQVLIYNRALTDAEIALLCKFPFYGFMNPDEIPVLDQYYTVAAGVTVPIMTYHYKQAGGL